MLLTYRNCLKSKWPTVYLSCLCISVIKTQLHFRHNSKKAATWSQESEQADTTSLPVLPSSLHSTAKESSLPYTVTCAPTVRRNRGLKKETQSALVYQRSVLQVIRPSMTQVCVVCKRPPPGDGSANHLSKSIFILFDVEGKGKGAEWRVSTDFNHT